MRILVVDNSPGGKSFEFNFFTLGTFFLLFGALTIAAFLFFGREVSPLLSPAAVAKTIEAPFSPPSLLKPGNSLPVSIYGMAIVSAPSGWSVFVPPSTPVRNVAVGTVQSASVDPVFGATVIVTHPNHYTSLYGHLEKLFVKKGDRVQRGDVLGTSSKHPLLYLLLRHGRPVGDPLLARTSPHVKIRP